VKRGWIFIIILMLAAATACQAPPGKTNPSAVRAAAFNVVPPTRLKTAVVEDLMIPACGAPQTLPPGYGQSEARWIVARFDENDSPFLGLYVYFWIDRYNVDGCLFHSTYGGLYTKDGAMFDNLFAGAHVTGTPVTFGATPYYDLAVYPLLRVRRDATNERLFHATITHPDFAAEFDIVVAHRLLWTNTYFSDYDAYLTGGRIDYGDETFHVTGRAILERWWDYGPYDPGDPTGELVEGYWLYEPFSWVGPDGRTLATMAWFRNRLNEDGEYVFSVTGAVAEGLDEWLIVGGELDFDFPENETSGGYLRRHRATLHLSDGRSLSYDVSAIKEYRDPFPAGWARFAPTYPRKAHTFASGNLEFDGVTFEGGGVWEWQVTTFNPLPTN
jgi:hypothetical protein